jgi:BirA family biotin operon repressor/biotin-[acetyl-CoA-carboxylase] ligase
VTTAGSDLLPSAVLPALTTRRLGRQYVFLPRCGSTNDEVATRAGTAPEGLLVATDEQTEGRGRRGRSWHSPAGENLYCSLLLRPALPARHAAPMTLLAGAALAEALSALGFVPRLKWPNDLMLDTPQGLRKVAGILTEMASEGDRVRHLVLGVGANVNSRELPDFLGAIATSLRLVGGQPLDRGRLLAAFLATLEAIYDDFLVRGPAPGLDRWRRHARLGQSCRVHRHDGRIDGVAADVDDTGALLLRTATGEIVPVHGGEVSWS